MSRLMTKPRKWYVRPAKIPISLGIRLVWSESLVSAWWKVGSLAAHKAHSEDSDQTGWKPRLTWVFAGHTDHFDGFVVRRLNFDTFPECKFSWVHICVICPFLLFVWFSELGEATLVTYSLDKLRIRLYTQEVGYPLDLTYGILLKTTGLCKMSHLMRLWYF